jgi:hypothetical protein
MVRENGRRRRLNLTVINTREITTMTKNMDMVNSIGKVEIIILETISMTKGMAMERCSGAMAPCTKETGSKASSMVSV